MGGGARWAQHVGTEEGAVIRDCTAHVKAGRGGGGDGGCVVGHCGACRAGHIRLFCVQETIL